MSVLRYHQLRAAQQKFQCDCSRLTAEQWASVETLAERTWHLECQVLTSSEAASITIADSQINSALATIGDRYDSPADWAQDLARNGLDMATLREALARELRFDAVMQHIGDQHPPVTEAEVAEFYAQNPQHFNLPERRAAQHLLITINEQFAENHRDAAYARLTDIAQAAANADAATFGQLARQHSECPTALENGRLGLVPRGQLYPALDAALFALAAGEISPIVESPMGLHLLRCESICAAHQVPLEQARPQIHSKLTQQRRSAQQRAWLAEL